MGYEPVGAVLRRRGHVPREHGRLSDILIPLDTDQSLSGELFLRYTDLFGKSSFRKLVRHLIAARSTPVPTTELERIAGGKAMEYVEFLVELGVADRSGEAVALTRCLNNIGPSLEWYVAQLCGRDLAGSAMWSVSLEGLPAGGDYDVLAWLAPTLVAIELKSSHPSQISESELRQFLQRTAELAPDMAVLLIDTDSQIDDVLAKLQAILQPLLGGPSDRLIIRLQDSYPGMHFGFRRIYVTNSKPSILTQLQRCLRHYHGHVKGLAFWSGPAINFITGEISDES